MLAFLVVVLEDAVVSGFSLELASAHELDFFHLCALGRNRVEVPSKVQRIRRIQERGRLIRLIPQLFLAFRCLLLPRRHLTFGPLFHSTEILTIQRLILGHIKLTIIQVILPLQSQLIHMVWIDLMELVVIGGVRSLGGDLVVEFGGFGDL